MATLPPPSSMPAAVTSGFFVLLCAQLLEEVSGLIFSYAAASTLWRRRSNPARPYMDRLMTFSRLICPSGAPGQRQGGMHGIAILTQAASEALEAPVLSGRDPAVELVGQALLDHGRERPGQVDRPGDRRRQLKQHEPAVVLTQLVRLAHQQARRLARGRRLGRLGRWRLICGRVLTALAGGPLADDARLPGEAALADLPPQPSPVATARGPAHFQVVTEGIEDAAVGMPPSRSMRSQRRTVLRPMPKARAMPRSVIPWSRRRTASSKRASRRRWASSVRPG